VYSISGLCAGLGGVMSLGRLYAANGIQLGQSYELDAIAAVILGGTSFVGGIGSIWGTLVGALIIAVISNGLILTGARHLAIHRKGFGHRVRGCAGPLSPMQRRTHIGLGGRLCHTKFAARPRHR
jgi:branched-subunit amino acid ABC-type transport system permease component